MEKRASADNGKKTWVAPRLEQLPMVDTSLKGEDPNEDTKSNMFMTPTGMRS